MLKTTILAFSIVISSISVASSASLDYSFLAGKDKSISNTDKNWEQLRTNPKLFSVVHALIHNRRVIFIKPKELAHASWYVKRRLAGKSHLTNIKVDRGYLDALTKVVKTPERIALLDKWKQENVAPVMTALIIPGNVDYKDLPQITNRQYLEKIGTRMLFQRPMQTFNKH